MLLEKDVRKSLTSGLLSCLPTCRVIPEEDDRCPSQVGDACRREGYCRMYPGLAVRSSRRSSHGFSKVVRITWRSVGGSSTCGSCWILSGRAGSRHGTSLVWPVHMCRQDAVSFGGFWEDRAGWSQFSTKVDLSLCSSSSICLASNRLLAWLFGCLLACGTQDVSKKPGVDFLGGMLHSSAICWPVNTSACAGVCGPVNTPVFPGMDWSFSLVSEDEYDRNSF